jgi:hypothetical protein
LHRCGFFVNYRVFSLNLFLFREGVGPKADQRPVPPTDSWKSLLLQFSSSSPDFGPSRRPFL